MGIGPLLQFSYPLTAGPVLLTLLFFPLVPSSYRVLCGSKYSLPLVRYSCLLSADVLHALLCLKVYSWCICGERCTPCPPTPPPSCSPLWNIFFSFMLHLVSLAYRELRMEAFCWTLQTRVPRGNVCTQLGQLSSRGWWWWAQNVL